VCTYRYSGTASRRTLAGYVCVPERVSQWRARQTDIAIRDRQIDRETRLLTDISHVRAENCRWIWRTFVNKIAAHRSVITIGWVRGRICLKPGEERRKKYKQTDEAIRYWFIAGSTCPYDVISTQRRRRYDSFSPSSTPGSDVRIRKTFTAISRAHHYMTRQNALIHFILVRNPFVVLLAPTTNSDARSVSFLKRLQYLPLL